MLAPSPTTSLPKSLLRNPSPSLRLRAQAELELRRRRRARQLQAWLDDPVALAAACGIQPDPWQAQALTASQPTILLNCGRQVGKTEVLALLLVRALLTPDSLAVILSPSERQSREVYRRVLLLWKRLQRPIGYRGANLSALELDNGSRLLALPGSETTTRGLANVSLLVIDESGYVPDPVAMAMLPVLAVSGGQLVAASTAAGRRGWWYAQIQAREPETLYVEVPSRLCPRIPASFMAAQARAMGAWWFSQEYECQFNEAVTSCFREADILSSLDSSLCYDSALFAP